MGPYHNYLDRIDCLKTSDWHANRTSQREGFEDVGPSDGRVFNGLPPTSTVRTAETHWMPLWACWIFPFHGRSVRHQISDSTVPQATNHSNSHLQRCASVCESHTTTVMDKLVWQSCPFTTKAKDAPLTWGDRQCVGVSWCHFHWEKGGMLRSLEEIPSFSFIAMKETTWGRGPVEACFDFDFVVKSCLDS